MVQFYFSLNKTNNIHSEKIQPATSFKSGWINDKAIKGLGHAQKPVRNNYLIQHLNLAPKTPEINK